MTTPADQPELIAWLRAQLDDDERVARACPDQTWTHRADRDYPTPDQAFPDHTLWLGDRLVEVGFGEGEPRPSEAEHIARHDPARVLAEVGAKRRILDEHQPGSDPCDAHDASLRTIECDTLRFLALPYADRPGYRDEWRP